MSVVELNKYNRVLPTVHWAWLVRSVLSLEVL